MFLFTLAVIALVLSIICFIFNRGVLYVLAAGAWFLLAVYCGSTTEYNYSTTGLPLVAFFVFCGLAMLTSFYFQRRKAREKSSEEAPTVKQYPRTNRIDARLERIRKVRSRGDQDYYY